MSENATVPAFGAVGGQLIALSYGTIESLNNGEVELSYLPAVGGVGDVTYVLNDRSLTNYVHHNLVNALKYAAGFARDGNGRVFLVNVQDARVPANWLTLPERIFLATDFGA